MNESRVYYDRSREACRYICNEKLPWFLFSFQFLPKLELKFHGDLEELKDELCLTDIHIFEGTYAMVINYE